MKQRYHDKSWDKNMTPSLSIEILLIRNRDIKLLQSGGPGGITNPYGARESATRITYIGDQRAVACFLGDG
jgi:hypothetical protein